MQKLFSKMKTLGTCSVENVLQNHVNEPTTAWKLIQSSQTVKRLQPTDYSNAKPAGHTRFVCISDTHNRTDRLEHPIPDGDVLIHAGDFTNCGTRDQVVHFNKFLSTLSHPHKVVIAGNHDISFDLASYDSLWSYFSCQREDPKEIQKQLTNCIYLEDEEVNVLGFRIFGSPWTPEFFNWSFMKARGDSIQEMWNKIPQGIDILVTHGPPLGHGDHTVSNERAGCLNLLHTVQSRVKPKYHIFGHIHEGYGITTDGITTFVNASSLTVQYRPFHPPIVFDLPNNTT
ncbi:metallophosphoesterase MPPED2-like [Montipora foliosa]|uniref:metallophosphoesterase MPPED2-like n=1 Tax=Montipora foliosa TaxID=591990 RepID=UPI0035F1035C